MSNFFTGPTPRLFAHRGASGEAPENTMPAFQRAAALGIVYMELDVHLTHDGHVVVFHDDTLERTTNGHGQVKDHTLAELQQLDAGYNFSPDDGRTFPFRGQGRHSISTDRSPPQFPARSIYRRNQGKKSHR